VHQQRHPRASSPVGRSPDASTVNGGLRMRRR
jgi:hypothetical protein